MKSYRDVYDFAAGAGSLEGYVYQRGDAPLADLNAWVGRLEKQYRALPPEVVGEFQDLLDGTVGRTIRSLVPRLGEDHVFIARLKVMVRGKLPESADDFDKTH